ncbi:hypothetical protein [Maricaulis alexandrii]|uniref:hypothetical protein n=1 Tax=Maricaulis alexandrii TaxID=2570354 RepID=UPI0011091308|nr:hypothetical protein [Maricaulis alexandrii]
MFACEALASALLALSAPDHGAYECVETEAGIAVARDVETAHRFATAIETARSQFSVHYGSAPQQRVAIVQGNTARAELAPRLIHEGYSVVLPWLDPAEERAQLAERIRAQVAGQLPDLPDDRIDALVARALPAPEEPTPRDIALDTAAIAHELGHLWYIRTFWTAEAGTESHYGGPAPDWLDEIAGVAMETGDLLDQRRAALRDPQRGPYPPLSDFLAMPHPLAVLAAAAAEQHQGEIGEGQARVIRLSGEDAERLLNGAATDPSSYYIQARGFLDYLTDRAGRAPLIPLTQALQSGQTLDEWLADAGAAHGLPGSVDALEADWEAWLGGVRGAP